MRMNFIVQPAKRVLRSFSKVSFHLEGFHTFQRHFTGKKDVLILCTWGKLPKWRRRIFPAAGELDSIMFGKERRNTLDKNSNLCVGVGLKKKHSKNLLPTVSQKCIVKCIILIFTYLPKYVAVVCRQGELNSVSSTKSEYEPHFLQFFSTKTPLRFPL